MKTRASKSELEILETLWTTSPLSAAEIHESVAERLPCNAKTVRSLLDRLQKKGLVERRKVHGVWVFTCTVPRDQFILQESKSFLSRFFGSDPVPLVAHLVNNDMLSDADIARLREILDKEQAQPGEKSHD